MTTDLTPYNPDQEFLIYQSDDGVICLQLKYENESIWMTQAQIAEIFQTTPQNITMHLKNIYQEQELREEATCKDSLQVREEGGRAVQRVQKFYNLDAVISVGFRVNSHIGTQFRIWANQKINEYIKKGFVMDDERLADPAKNDYFEELLSRVRAIRASERYFYQKVTDIFATSIDYKEDTKEAKKVRQDFFASVQNKFHYAIHHHTAPEVIYERVDGTKPNMGMSHFKGDFPTLDEAKRGLNYLNEPELKELELLVDQYLSFAELQAMNRKEMKMMSWIAKLHDFLHLNDKDILKDLGKISRDMADAKVEKEHKVFMKNSYLSDFDQFAIETTRKAKKVPKKAK